MLISIFKKEKKKQKTKKLPSTLFSWFLYLFSIFLLCCFILNFLTFKRWLTLMLNSWTHIPHHSCCPIYNGLFSIPHKAHSWPDSALLPDICVSSSLTSFRSLNFQPKHYYFILPSLRYFVLLFNTYHYLKYSTFYFSVIV